MHEKVCINKMVYASFKTSPVTTRKIQKINSWVDCYSVESGNWAVWYSNSYCTYLSTQGRNFADSSRLFGFLSLVFASFIIIQNLSEHAECFYTLSWVVGSMHPFFTVQPYCQIVCTLIFQILNWILLTCFGMSFIEGFCFDHN